MAAKTYSQLYADALRQADEESGSGSTTARTIIKAGINESYSEIAGLRDWPTLENTTTFTSTANTNEYTPITSSTTIPRIRRVISVLDETNNKYLEEVQRDVFERSYPYVNTTNDTGTPSIWYHSGYDSSRDFKLKLWLVPDDASTTYRIFYQEEPVELVADTDEPRIPDQYHYGLTYLALAKYFEFQKDPMANYYRSLHEEFKRVVERAEWGNTDEMPEIRPQGRGKAFITGKLGRVYN